MLDVRFATSLQVMLSLALAHESGVALLSSADLAEGVGTNPSAVRKLVGALLRAQLVESVMGKAGGVRLARPPAEITLGEIYVSAVGDKRVLARRADIAHRCVVTNNLEPFVEELSAEVEDAIVTRLRGRTLLESLAELHRRERARLRKRA